MNQKQISKAQAKADAIAKAKREATYARTTTVSVSAPVATTAPVNAPVVKTETAKGKTLFYASSIDGKVSGVSHAWRYFYFAWYALQIKEAQPALGKFPMGKPFRMYPSFTSGTYQVNAGYWRKLAGIREFEFTAKGSEHFAKYPCENTALLAEWKNAILTGKIGTAMTKAGKIEMADSKLSLA